MLRRRHATGPLAQPLLFRMSGCGLKFGRESKATESGETMKTAQVVASAVVLFALTGCSSVRTQQRPANRAEHAKSDLGTIGVVAARVSPLTEFKTEPIDPARKVEGASGGEIAKGAAVGAVVGGGMGAVIGCLVGLMCGPLFAPACCAAFGLMGMGGGAISGAILGGVATRFPGTSEEDPGETAEPQSADAIGVPLVSAVGRPAASVSEKLAEAGGLESYINEVSSGVKLQEGLRDNVVKTGQARTRRSFVGVDDLGPAVPHEEVSYTALGSYGIDTVIEVAVEAIGWSRGESRTPVARPALFMTAWVRLVRVADDQVVDKTMFRFEGVSRSADEWTQPTLEREIDYAFKWLAERIVAHAVAQTAFASIGSTPTDASRPPPED